jgi:hypothetical protein
MKLFESVTLVADQSLTLLAGAVRATLESFGLQVNYQRLVQRRQALELFSAGFDTPYTVLLSHGDGHGEAIRARFEVRHQQDDQYDEPYGWNLETIDFTATTIPQLYRASGTVISTACGGGQEALARAYLRAGATAFIGSNAETDDLHLDSALVFLTNFFYFKTFESRDFAPHIYTDLEACELACSLDGELRDGMRTMRYYDSSS